MENGITPSLHGVKEIDQIIFAQSLIRTHQHDSSPTTKTIQPGDVWSYRVESSAVTRNIRVEAIGLKKGDE
jgi:hypothetical protein